MATPDPTTEAYVSDYLARREAKLGAAPSVVSSALNRDKYLKLSQNPELLGAIYAEDSTKAPSNVSLNPELLKMPGAPKALDLTGFTADQARNPVADIPDMQMENVAKGRSILAGKMRSDYTVALEEAMNKNRGQIPNEFFVQFSPADLRFIGGSGFEQVAQYVEQRQHAQSLVDIWQQRLDKDVQTEVDLRAKQRTQSRNLHSLFQGMDQGATRAVVVSDTERAQIRKELDMKRQHKTDTLYETEIATYLERQKSMMTKSIAGFSDKEIQDQLDQYELDVRSQLVAGVDSAKVLGTQDPVMALVEGGLGAMSWVIKEALVPGITTLFANPFAPSFVRDRPNPLTKALAKGQEAKMQRDLQEVEDYLANPPDPLNLAMPELQSKWDQMPKEDPETYQTQMKMAGGDPMLAFGLWAADVSSAPAAQEQMAGYVQKMQANEYQRMQQIKEEGFRASGAVMDAISWYGQWVNHNAAGFLSLLTDEDLYSPDHLESLGTFFDGVHKAAVTAGTPSAVLGIDGSLAGLVTDLGMGMIFDPTVWFFGARGSVRSAVPLTEAEIEASVRGAMIQQGIKDIHGAWGSADTGPASALHHMPLEGVAIGELADLLGPFPDAVFPRGAWRKGKGAAMAQEIPTDFLGPLAKTVPEDAALTESLMAKGFDKPITVSVDRLTHEIRVTDGAKRLASARAVGGTHVPVKFEVVADLGGVVDATWGALARGEGMNITTEVLDRATQQKVIQATELVRAGDVKITTLGEFDGYVVKKVQEGSTARYWAEPTAPGPKPVVAAVGSDGVGGSAAVAPGLEGGGATGLFSKFMDMAAKDNPMIVAEISKSETVSISAARWIQKYAIRKIEADAPKAGITIEKLLKDAGLQEKRPLLDFGAPGALETKTMRPDTLLPDELWYPDVPMEEMTQIVKRAMQRGWTPDFGKAGIISRAYSELMRRTLGNTKADVWAERYISPMNIGKDVSLVGPGAMERMYDNIYRIWGADTAKADIWTKKLFDYQAKLARDNREAITRLELTKPLTEQIRALEDMTGGGWGDNLAEQRARLATEAAEPKTFVELSQAERNIKQAVLAKQALSDQLNEITRAEVSRAVKMSDTQPIIDIWEAMQDDYNRTYIATNPAWSKWVDKETGLVPWERLEKGFHPKQQAAAQALEKVHTHVTQDMRTDAVALGFDADKLAKQHLITENIQMSMKMHLSPIEMLMARETGGAKWVQLTHNVAVSRIRDLGFGLNTLWVMDKVFRGATAITVSFDELLRILHYGGPEAGAQWMHDRAIFMKARSEALLHEGTVREGTSVGAKYLSPKNQERIRALGDFQNYLKQGERVFYDTNGLGWVDILPGEPGYRAAALQWTGNLLQDTGFRAYLQGPEAYRVWFFGPDGETARQSVALAKDATGSYSTRLMAAPEAMYEGFDTLFRRLMLKDAYAKGNGEMVFQEFKTMAERIDAGGGRALNISDRVIDHLGPVRGAQKYLGKNWVKDSFGKAGDALFMNPINYRRGLLSEMVRKAERSRIESLMAQQGKRIMSDAEVANQLGLQGLGGAYRLGFKQVFNEIASKAGYVTESMVSDIVERAVMKEVQNMLYTWDVGSRMGQAGRAVFPFGKPWADMIGFWGREMLRKPVMRGWINESNFLGLKALEHLPFNPKTAGLVSRLAATDFDITHGYGDLSSFGREDGKLSFGPQKNVGLLPGSQSSDLSPLFFLPTGGDNPFGQILPGMGYLPMGLLDFAFKYLHDPIKEPEEYQKLLETVGDFLPSVGYQTSGSVMGMLAGGSIDGVIRSAVDGVGLASSELGESQTWFNFTSAMGDITREVSRTRQIKSLLSDPEELAALLEATDVDTVNGLLQGLGLQADKLASGADLLRVVSRSVVPANNLYDQSISDSLDVWVEASKKFPELNVRPELQNANMDDWDVRQQYANDVRRAFFDQPQWKKDLFVAQYPQLAVNLVGGWEWTPAAQAANIAGTDTTYRTSGTQAGLAQHQSYIDNGYVRPLQPIEMARRILGYTFAAKEKSAKQLYTMAAEQVNLSRWAQVPEDWKANFDFLAQSSFGKTWGIKDGHELWANWGSLESKVEEWNQQQVGLPKGTDVSDAMKKAVNFPTKYHAWGTTWSGDNADNITQQFGDTLFGSFTEPMQQIADGLGIDLAPGMSGEQLYYGAKSVIDGLISPLYTVTKLSYDTYTGERSQAAGSIDTIMTRIANKVEYAPSWRQGVTEFMKFADNIEERYRESIGGVPATDQQEVADRFASLVATFSGDDPGWGKIWHDRYERNFGPVDWTPPEPKSPFREDGKQSSKAVAPYIVHFMDGDSIVVKDKMSDVQTYQIRLLGVDARDYGSDVPGATEDQQRLSSAIQEAERNGDTIWFVRDPETFKTNTDQYGRVLAWLWLGDTPYYFPEDFRRNQTPSGGAK